MWRLVTAVLLGLATSAANAQDTTSEQSRTSAVANTYGTQPFKFDGRMPSDRVRQRAPADNRAPDAGAIVVQPKESQPGRER